MDNNNIQPVTTQESSNTVPNSCLSFSSEEAMKTFYLQLANQTHPSIQNCISEIVRLEILDRKIKQFINALNFINVHDWGKGITEIHNATGVFMLQKDYPNKLLLQTNREIGQHLQFLMKLAGNVAIMKQLESFLNHHHKNLMALLRILKKESESIEN